MAIEFNGSGAASPDDIPAGEKVHPFQQFLPGEVNPPPPSTEGTGSEAGLVPPPVPQSGSEDDISDFDANNALSRLFSLGSTAVERPSESTPPASASQGVERVEGEASPAEKPAAQAPPEGTQVQGLNDKELAIINEYRSGDLQKKIAVIEQFEANPVAFVEQYAPEIRQAVIERAAADVLSPEEFALQWAEHQLEQKYGTEFEFNPADVAIRGSASERYFTDKQLLLAEGSRRYSEAQNQKNAEQAANRQRVEQTARKVLVEMGFAPTQYDEVIRIAESLPSTPETYYRMLFTFLRAENHVQPNGKSGAPPPASQQINRSSSLPPNTNGVPGKTVSPPISREAKNLVELFGVDLL